MPHSQVQLLAKAGEEVQLLAKAGEEAQLLTKAGEEAQLLAKAGEEPGKEANGFQNDDRRYSDGFTGELGEAGAHPNLLVVLCLDDTNFINVLILRVRPCVWYVKGTMKRQKSIYSKFI